MYGDRHPLANNIEGEYNKWDGKTNVKTQKNDRSTSTVP